MSRSTWPQLKNFSKGRATTSPLLTSQISPRHFVVASFQTFSYCALFV
jgi:hypothetical protein